MKHYALHGSDILNAEGTKAMSSRLEVGIPRAPWSSGFIDILKLQSKEIELGLILRTWQTRVQTCGSLGLVQSGWCSEIEDQEEEEVEDEEDEGRGEEVEKEQEGRE